MNAPAIAPTQPTAPKLIAPLPKLMLTIAVLGCMMGWLAQWRQSSKPGMLSHFIQDAIGGIVMGRH